MNKKLYVSYEEGSTGEFTEKEMKELYQTEVNKEEYADYEDWLYDVIKSGVFERLTEKDIK